MSRRLVLVGGTLVYVGVSYATYTYLRKPAAAEPTLQVDPATHDTCSTWNSIASDYDARIGKDERWLGIGLLRRYMMGKYARGDVLEVSTGTGRNLPYYRPSMITSLTLSDKSPVMLDQAKQTWQRYAERFKEVPVLFKVMDAETLVDGEQYDTIVDTFGLCSCTSPTTVLVHLAKQLKPEARLVLLEHGRSHYDWLNRMLDSHAQQHVQKWGCWWNRDMLAMLADEEVKQVLEVEYVRRWHLGTTYYVICRRKKENDQ
ncbi:hypothetical protein BZG36_02794 [Bifiguratus adelaidae]|uniref:Methyltransferase domain-containing protein n=1 Tax=Bifiguratus adelaidae TaxID=1938954 RepID=A0A261Y1F0_9FUNG|nr:hypothetical protein BZG36_02794 [Bifiguratus adelaidae]